MHITIIAFVAEPFGGKYSAVGNNKYDSKLNRFVLW